jgi:hypothetical protein
MDELSGRAAWARKQQPHNKTKYRYDGKGCYGEVELRATPDGKRERVAQLRAAGSGSPGYLPIELLALMTMHAQEIRLDTCAQFSVSGMALRKYGRCMTRDAPIDVVDGFGGGRYKVLGVWRFRGTTVYRQTIVFDALLIEGQGDELLLGVDWMVERQVKLDFGNRELKYRDEKGHKVILPFTCHIISLLQRPGDVPIAVVRLAKTVKLTANTRNVVILRVNAEEGPSCRSLGRSSTCS